MCARVLITPTGQLPDVLSRIRRQFVSDAVEMNGNSLCLVPSGVDEIRFRHDGVFYVIRKESFGMDWDLFNCEVENICRELVAAGCELEG